MSDPVQREHQWWIARYVKDDLRGETRNVAVLLRIAGNDKPQIRFLDPVPFLAADHQAEWQGWRDYWTAVWDKHGNVKPFYWVSNRSKHAPHIYWELAGTRLASIVDFNEMYDVLVKPS